VSLKTAVRSQSSKAKVDCSALEGDCTNADYCTAPRASVDPRSERLQNVTGLKGLF